MHCLTSDRLIPMLMHLAYGVLCTAESKKKRGLSGSVYSIKYISADQLQLGYVAEIFVKRLSSFLAGESL